MTTLKPQPWEEKRDVLPPGIAFPPHSSFYPVQQKLVSWVTRFPRYEDPFLFRELLLFYLLAGEKYLDYRHPIALARLIKAIYFMQKKLLQSSTSSSVRHLEMKWIPLQLTFSFTSKSVLGCLVGFNLVERHEIFDEENVSLILQKHFPQFQLVKDSSYAHVSSGKDFKMFYFEIEKNDASVFSLQEQRFLKKHLEQKLKNGIQRLAPNIFMKRNEEEVYKNVLVLCEQIQSVHDQPQAIVHLDQQTLDEIIFLVTLVYVLPSSPFLLQERLPDGFFASERRFTVRYLQNLPIEAHIFRIHLHRKPVFLRSDGSLDFYSARRKAVEYLHHVVGTFRDYNGGILLKQQELMQSLKESYPQISATDVELLETFFYSINPPEKQVLLQPKTLATLFEFFSENQRQTLKDNYVLKVVHEGGSILLALCSAYASIKETLAQFLNHDACGKYDLAYNLMEQEDRLYFQCALFPMDESEGKNFIASFQEALSSWEKRITNPQILRIGFEYSLFSLDPRKGGDAVSQVISGLLFEGLTWFDGFGKVKNGIAKQIHHSEDHTEYTFHLRDCVWNDGSPLTAHDFEYAWKKILSPDFKTAFAYLFYPIRGAKEAKQGQIPLDAVGIRALDEQTLHVNLKHPTPYFLELTSHPIYSPIHRIIDRRYPEWPDQEGVNYPCNGAFVLKINHPSQGYKIEKNSLYWDADNIALDQIIFNQMTPHQSFDAFKKGEIDWLGHPLGGWNAFYTPGPDDRVISISNAAVYWYVFKTSEGPFRSKKLRKAIALAIQRSEFLANSPLPLAPAYSPLPQQHSSSTIPRFSHNIELARQLWKEGWEELGFALTKIPPLTFVYHHRGIREHIAAHLQRQLQECFHAPFELQPLSWNLQFEKMSKGDFEMGLAQWTPWIDDPIYTLNSFRFSNENLNISQWNHPGFQDLLTRCEQEVNPAKRMAYYATAEELLCQEIPVIPLFYQSFQTLVKNSLNVSYNISRATFNFARCFYRKKGVFQ